MKISIKQLPLGAVRGTGQLATQLIRQASHITGDMELYDAFKDSGWLGGNGESWERGPYYARGLVALAYVLDDDLLIYKARKWINWSLNSQKENGDFGPNPDMWAKMPMLMAIRDYYEAERYKGNEDSRVLPFFENYFRYQKRYFTWRRLWNWGRARGADNIEVLLWYKDKLMELGKDEKELGWIDTLARRLLKTTQDWEKKMRHGDKLRYHVVNTTQGFKHPYIKYRITGDNECLKSLYKGLESIKMDHGRIDGLPNADEAARDNLPTRGTETCAVVEGMLSLEMAGSISGDAKLYDLLESYAYNNLPNCFDYDITGYCYYQQQNQMLATHGSHGFVNDHGDSSAIGIGAFECCFSNLHMGYPKFVQNLWGITDDSLVLTAYGSCTLDTVMDGKKIQFEEITDYPYEDNVRLMYKGEKTHLKLMFRIPEWTKDFIVKYNGTKIIHQEVGGFALIQGDYQENDRFEICLKSEMEVLDWHHKSMYVKKGAVLYCNPIKEDWRITEDYSYRGVKYSPKGNSNNYEIYPAGHWKYSFEQNDTMHYSDNPLYDNTRALTPKNYPGAIGITMYEVTNWGMDGNVCATVEDAIKGEPFEGKLIPYACSRLKISLFPKFAEEGKEISYTQETVIRNILSQMNRARKFETKADRCYELAQLTFPIVKRSTATILWGTEPGVYNQAITEIPYNRYTTLDDYGKRIEQDKCAFPVEEGTQYYARVVVMKNKKVIAISNEAVV